jgi:hypothetical protein
MFENVGDAGLIDAISTATRAESAAIARRLAAVGELFERRAQHLRDCQFWFTDPVAAVAAEISAAQNVSRARAVGQVYYARVLRDRLPQIAAVFATGAIDLRMVLTIIARTENVDDDVIVHLDEALARHVQKWMKLSGPKLVDRLDLWVAKFDPAGVRVPPTIDENRTVEIFERGPGMAGIWASVHAEDAALVDKRLDALAATVCANDPRTAGQRRADACGALARLQSRLACQCGCADCPAATEQNALKDVVIHVLAEQGTLDGSGDHPGYLPGFGILPAESVRRIATTATHKPLTVPAGHTEPGYRPSAGLSQFVAWRDLTCRFPGCDAPAAVCDIDHTAPYPGGPTHPSNTKLYCRTHHLLKTFFTGPNGWSERQLPDGTVIWTAPTGHIYRTEPHGGALFPALATPTGALHPAPKADHTDTNRTAMMPTRRQTRDQDRRDRIAKERRQRAELITEQQRQRQAWLAANYEPPPF